MEKRMPFYAFNSRTLCSEIIPSIYPKKAQLNPFNFAKPEKMEHKMARKWLQFPGQGVDCGYQEHSCGLQGPLESGTYHSVLVVAC
jgi:hypothetical protein